MNNSDSTDIYATVLMNTFTGRILRIKVAKKPEMINEDLLVDSTADGGESDDDPDKKPGIWKSISE